MSKPLSLLPISVALLSKLNKAGYSTIGDVQGVDAETLARDLKVPKTELSTLRDFIDRPQSTLPPSMSAQFPATSLPATQQRPFQFPSSQPVSTLLNTIRASKTTPHLFTSGFETIDHTLDGGLKKGQCLEISGPPGSGRHLIALEFVRRFLKTSKEGEVLIIDCQNSLAQSRLLSDLLSNGVDGSAEHEDRSPQRVDKRVHHVAINGFAELFAFLNQISKYLASNPMISLILFASLSTPFQSVQTHSVKTRLLTSLKSILTRLTSTSPTVGNIGNSGSVSGLVCIVTMNLSTKMQSEDGKKANFDTAGAKAVMVPALGDAWLIPHITYRALLYRDHLGKRYFCITSTPSSKDTLVSEPVEFIISDGRIRMP